MTDATIFRRQRQKDRNEAYHYKACGLDGIYLLNGYHEVDHDGETHVFVDGEEELHRVIARHVICTRKSLTGKEIRFLRKTMDWTQKELAERLGNDSQAVAHWEKDHHPIPAYAEKLLRIVVLAELLTPNEVQTLERMVRERLSELDAMDECVTPPAAFMLDKQHWRDKSRACG